MTATTAEIESVKVGIRSRHLGGRSVVGLRLLALALGLLLPLVLLEGGFRAFGPFLPGEYNLGIEREFDPLLGWRHRPGYAGGSRTQEFAVRFAINDKGLRDEVISYDKPAGGFRVLALGDSFLAAAHVPLEQAMTKQLQSLLRAALAPRPADVVNAGVAGYGTAQEYLYLEHEGFKYSPDVVIVVVFLGNDLIDNVRSAEGRWERPAFNVDGDDRLVQIEQPSAARVRRTAWEDFLVRNSTVYNFVQSGFLRKLEASETNAGETGEEAGQDFQIYERRSSSKMRKAWEVTEALIGAIARKSDSIGARTVVVGAPSFRQLSPARFEQSLTEERLDHAPYDIELPDRQLEAAAARLKVPYLDLLPELRRADAAGEGEMFYPRNTHWAPAGQRTVAAAVFQFMQSAGLLASG